MPQFSQSENSNIDGNIPPGRACVKSHEEAINWLLDHPDNVNFKDNNGTSLLHLACEHNHSHFVDILLTHSDIDVNPTDSFGDTPLLMACYNGHVETVKKLLTEPKTQVNLANNGGISPLSIACSNGYDEQPERSFHGNSRRHITFFDHQKSTSDIIISYRQEIKADRGCGYDYQNLVEELLNHPDINVNLSDVHGNTPLHIACQTGNSIILEKLLTHKGIEINPYNNFGHTPFYIACKSQVNNAIQGYWVILALLQHRELVIQTIPNNTTNFIKECLDDILKTTLGTSNDNLDNIDNLRKCAVLLYIRGFKPENPESNNLYQNWLQYNDNKNQYYHELHQKDLIATTNPVASLKELSIFAANKLKNIPQWYPPMLLKMPTSSLKGMLDDFIQDGGMQPGYTISKPGLTR